MFYLMFLLIAWTKVHVPWELDNLGALYTSPSYTITLPIAWTRYLWTIGPLMKTQRTLTAIIERDGDGYVSLCPELDVASQGDTIEEARANLIEALELFFETASPSEVKVRLHDEVLVTSVKVAV